MLSFSLIIGRRIALAALPQFFAERPIYEHINQRFLHLAEAELREYLVRELERAGALKLMGGWLAAA